ncbi:uncharacterized protein LY89DRAFT_510444 [Mollisia scopiformis]|uniref:Uncharacterized protein n=1 Tax=Mollisia scopiformis TaxID=149040 RepID=A0A194XFP1_MOLSC|nr:uncharacterized protein LY89DRAFT_510444 [Mollisia scopiformis]KUJ19015.1 hypothetical protein LY89DRAFT_510444 [Mollisia scopiformis]
MLPTKIWMEQTLCGVFHPILLSIANPSYRSPPEFTTNVPYRDFVELPADADVFWDASDLVSSQETSLNFGHLSSSSYAGSWTDASYTDLLSWSPNSSITAPDSTRASLASAAPDSTRADVALAPKLPQHDAMDLEQTPAYEQIDPRDVILPLPHSCPMQHYPSLSYPSPSDEASVQPAPAAPTPQNDQSLSCSEDPFMGWASKRASQMFDEYNWVLSHVETL